MRQTPDRQPLATPRDGAPTEATAALRLYLLGSFRLQTRDGVVLEPSLRKSCALLSVLAMSRGGETRERLCDLLWRDAPASRARASLRQCLADLRQKARQHALSIIESRDDRLWLAAGAVWVDALELRGLENLSSSAALVRLKDLWAGELLSAQSPNEDGFEAWLQRERENLRLQVTGSIETALDEAIAAREPERVAELAGTLVQIDPVHERGFQGLMLAALWRGDRASALRHYEALVARLAQALDSQPSVVTRRLLDADAQPLTSNVTTAPARDGGPAWKPVLVVLPLADRSPSSAATRHLCEGVTEDLNTALTRFRQFAVIARYTALAAAERHADVREIGAELGASFVLGGSIRWTPEGVELRVQLDHCEDATQVWGERYSFVPEQAFDVLDQIVSRVALVMSRVSVQAPGPVAGGEPQATPMSRPANFQAYEYCLRARAQVRLWTASGDERALALYSQAVALDPNYAPAHTGLAGIYNSRDMLRPGHPGNADDLRRGRLHAERAVSLDPLDALNHVNLAFAHLIHRHFELADRHFQWGVQANPNDADVLIAAAVGLGYLGAPEAGELAPGVLTGKALRLNPETPTYYRAFEGSLHFMRGDYDLAIAEFDAIPIDVIPDIQGWRAAAYALSGRAQEARRIKAAFVREVRATWQGEARPSEADVAAWLLSITPMRAPDTMDSFVTGLAAAGLTLPRHRVLPEGHGWRAVLGRRRATSQAR